MLLWSLRVLILKKELEFLSMYPICLSPPLHNWGIGKSFLNWSLARTFSSAYLPAGLSSSLSPFCRSFLSLLMKEGAPLKTYLFTICARLYRSSLKAAMSLLDLLLTFSRKEMSCLSSLSFVFLSLFGYLLIIHVLWDPLQTKKKLPSFYDVHPTSEQNAPKVKTIVSKHFPHRHTKEPDNYLCDFWIRR